MNKKANAIFWLFLFSTAWCFGYIDPGSGSYIIQIIIAAFLGISVGLKLFWKKIKLFFQNLFSKNPKQTEPGETPLEKDDEGTNKPGDA